MMPTWLLFLCALLGGTGAAKPPSPASGPTLKSSGEI